MLLKALQLSNPKDAGQQEAVFGADRSHKDRTLHFWGHFEDGKVSLVKPKSPFDADDVDQQRADLSALGDVEVGFLNYFRLRNPTQH